LVQAGMDDMWISLDGVDLIHDRVRGRDGTFKRVEQSIEWLREARGTRPIPRLRANCTISKYNVESFDKLLDFAEEKGMDSVHLEYVGEFWQDTVDRSVVDGIKPTPYFIREGSESSLVNEKEGRLVKEKIARMKELARGMRVKLYTENVDKLTVENMAKGRFENKKCYIIRFKVSVDPSGFVLGCPFFGDWRLGNIQEEPLEKIWRNEKHRRIMKAFKKGEMQLCRYCILGVMRNPTFFQDVRDVANAFLGRVRM